MFLWLLECVVFGRSNKIINFFYFRRNIKKSEEKVASVEKELEENESEMQSMQVRLIVGRDRY